MACSVVVLGSVNTDLVIRGPRLPRPGETVLGGEFYQAGGGKGANQAVAAARAGVEPTLFIAAVGDDEFGQAARRNLARENLVCDYINSVPDQPSGVALILVDECGENAISVASGANHCLSPADVDAVPDAAFTAAKVFLACLESPLDTVVHGVQRARALGLTTVLNPAPATRELPAAGVLNLVDVITPNRSEAALLTGVEVEDAESAIAAGKQLCQAGCGAAVVTLGADGAVIVSPKGEVQRVPARMVEAVDATAAGDVFNGALAVGLAEGRSLSQAAQWACAAASLSTTRRGAQPSVPTRREIEAFLD